MDFEHSQKKTFTKRGYEYTRKGYDVKVATADKFKRKCQRVGLCETQCVEMLVEHFCQATGWGPEIKHPPMFEQRPQEHIKEAVSYVVHDYFPWVKKSKFSLDNQGNYASIGNSK